MNPILLAIAEESLIPKEHAVNLLATLWEVDSAIPKEIAGIRPSLVAFNNVMKWGGRVEDALASSLLAMNAKHGCFNDAYDFIHTWITDNELARTLIDRGFIVPGFGNPVFKEEDYRCEEIKRSICENTHPNIQAADYIIEMAKEIESMIGVKSNLVFWNAAVVYLLGLPRHYASLMFILATQVSYIKQLKTQE